MIVEVIETDLSVDILTEQIQGPPGVAGPMGPAGSTSTTVKAGAEVGGHKIVTLNTGGKAVYASSDAPFHSNRILGMSLHAASAEADLSVLRDGEVTEPTWSWNVNLPVYLGLDGALTQTLPAESAFALIVGFPISPTKIYFSIGTPIITSN